MPGCSAYRAVLASTSNCSFVLLFLHVLAMGQISGSDADTNSNYTDDQGALLC